MATKKDIKELLKKLNLKESDMDTYWNELIETNSLVKQLNKRGKTWRDMNISFIAKIPTQKQRDIEVAERKKKEEEEKIESELKAKQEKEYYENHYEEIILNKIDSGEKLNKSELSNLVWDFEEVDCEYGDNRRWSRSVTSIVKINDRFFCIKWENGLTENQENEFYDQPYEVEKKTYEKTITVTEWVSKK
jgi:hypothetical protein